VKSRDEIQKKTVRKKGRRASNRINWRLKRYAGQEEGSER